MGRPRRPPPIAAEPRWDPSPRGRETLLIRSRCVLRGALVVLVGCNGAGSAAGEPLARVDEEHVDAAVVRMIAERDGVDEAEARARVADTLRLVAAAREAAAGRAEPVPLVEPGRQEHLERAARARVWLQEDFEPDRQADDIPDGDAMLEQAKATAKFIHPELHLVCQLVAVPTDAKTPEEVFAITADEAWMDKARARFDPVADRMQRYVGPRDPEACDLMTKLMRFEQREGDGVTLRVEAQGFDLDACAEKNADGSCKKPVFVPEWVKEVRAAEPPGFIAPFRTPFGWHLVFVAEILPAHELDDPETAAWLRREIHPQWQRKAFDEYIAQLREQRAVRIAASESPP
jgi:hypothetical protein